MKHNRTIQILGWPLAAVLLLALAISACTPTTAQGAICSTHQIAEKDDPWCNRNLVQNSRMCQEHGVPEALCSRCKPALIAGFKAESDWCGEHNLPESQCTTCNPGLKKPYGDEVSLTPDAIRQSGIRVEPARMQSLDDVFTVPGRVSYNTEAMAHVGTPVHGRVATLNVKLGDMVKQGGELLVIDSPALGEAQSEYLQRRTQVEVAESAVDVAKTASERAQRLLEGRGIALGEVQRRQGEYKSAVGALKTAKSALTAAENSLHLYGISEDEVKRLIKTGEVNPRYTVFAPMEGRVVRREVTLGEVVGPDRDALLTLADMKTLWVLADVPENQVKRITVGTSATVTVGALEDQAFNGKVTYIAPELNNETRTVQVRVEIEDGMSLKPGMFAQVHLTLEDPTAKTSDSGLVVPEAAVQNFEGGQAVFVAVAGEPGTFSARPVKLGRSNGEMVAVLEGLDDDAQVVTQGSFIIKAELAKSIMEGKTCSGH